MEYGQNDGQPGTRRFRIWVQGRLDEGFSEGLAGIEQEDVPAGTMLSGAMLDQSRMHSTLDLLRSLGIDTLRWTLFDPRCGVGPWLLPGNADPRVICGFVARKTPDANGALRLLHGGP